MRAHDVLFQYMVSKTEIRIAFSNLFCIEKCRGCGSFVEEKLGKPLAFCAECWSEFEERSPLIEFCKIDDLRSIVIASAVPYEGLIKQLVYRLKYDSDRVLAEDFSLLSQKAIDSLNASLTADLDDPSNRIIVPIPLHWYRLVKRGFNQADLIACGFAKYTGWPRVPQALQRCRATQAHHNLGKVERLENVSGAFKSSTALVAGKTIILVDDIYTSGATLAEAARLLLASGATRVAAIVVARAKLRSDG